MITNEQIEQHLRECSEIQQAFVSGDGYHYQITVISNHFIGQSKVARQRWVYSKLKHYITEGSLHALSMTTLTNEEWEKNHG